MVGFSATFRSPQISRQAPAYLRLLSACAPSPRRSRVAPRLVTVGCCFDGTSDRCRRPVIRCAHIAGFSPELLQLPVGAQIGIPSGDVSKLRRSSLWYSAPLASLVRAGRQVEDLTIECRDRIGNAGMSLESGISCTRQPMPMW